MARKVMDRRCVRVGGVLVGLVAWAWWGATPADAAPIRQNAARRLPLSLRRIIHPDGTLRDTAYVRTLVWRRARDPQTFSRRHPRIAPLFRNIPSIYGTLRGASYTPPIARASRGAAMQVLEATVEPKSAAQLACVEQQIGGAPRPTPIPEPSTLATSLCLVGLAGGWWRRRALRGPGRAE